LVADTEIEMVLNIAQPLDLFSFNVLKVFAPFLYLARNLSQKPKFWTKSIYDYRTVLSTINTIIFMILI